MDNFDFSDFFTTKIEANNFADSLSAISQGIYQTNFNLEHVLIQQFGIHKKDLFMTMLHTNNIAFDSTSALKAFIDTLHDKIITLPTISITIAFEPQEETLQKITQWFLLQKNKQVLLDIKIDKDLIGGTSLAFNGKHADFSIKPVFQRIVQEMLTPNIQNQTSVKNQDHAPQVANRSVPTHAQPISHEQLPTKQ